MKFCQNLFFFCHCSAWKWSIISFVWLLGLSSKLLIWLYQFWCTFSCVWGRISIMASRMLAFKSPIVSGLSEYHFSLMVLRRKYDKSIVARDVLQVPQSINCDMKCVANCTILLKSKFVHINTMKSEYKKIVYYAVIGVSIDLNGCFVLIFKEIWAPFHKPHQTVIRNGCIL